MENNVLIANQRGFENIKSALKKDGKNKIHFLMDFDRTLTNYFVQGVKVPSLISILRDGHYLTPDYGAKAQALFDKYHPWEVDQNIQLKEKRELMKEWWIQHFHLLIASGLKKKDIDDVVRSGKVNLRSGCVELFSLLNKNDISVVIMSNSGLGTYAITEFLRQANCFFGNIYVISNEFIWDREGKAIGIKEPIMHGGCKALVSLKDYPEIFPKVEDRRNVILVGDSDSDIDMIEGFSYGNLLKIGFLNDDAEILLEHYKNIFDVLLFNDAPMDFIIDFTKQII